MKTFLYRNILIYGSDPSRGEKWAAAIILIAIFAAVVVLDPC